MKELVRFTKDEKVALKRLKKLLDSDDYRRVLRDALESKDKRGD